MVEDGRTRTNARRSIIAQELIKLLYQLHVLFEKRKSLAAVKAEAYLKFGRNLKETATCPDHYVCQAIPIILPTSYTASCILTKTCPSSGLVHFHETFI